MLEGVASQSLMTMKDPCNTFELMPCILGSTRTGGLKNRFFFFYIYVLLSSTFIEV